MNCSISESSFVSRLRVLHDSNWPEYRSRRRWNVSLFKCQHICNNPYVTVQIWSRKQVLTLGGHAQHFGSNSSNPQELGLPAVAWQACGARVMRIGRMTGLTLRMMHPGRWKEQIERFEPQRDELAARLGNSFLRYFCSL